MSWLRRVKDFGREYRDLVALRTLPPQRRRLIFYAEDVHTWNQLAGYVRPLLDVHGRSVVYVSSDPRDPLFESAPDRLEPYHLDRFLPTYLPQIDSGILVLTAPDLGNLHVGRPADGCRCVYVFHSLNSIHEQYNERAFHHYDDVFAVGPHHVRELEAYYRVHGLAPARLHEVGYPKVDSIHLAMREFRKRHPERKTVLIAPSWGKGNVLESLGETLIDRLVAEGHRVIVRPHPAFFLPMYPGEKGVVDRLARRFASCDTVEIERNIESDESFYEADVMISDYSGAALEYALGTARPVLLFDVDRKRLNPHWERLGLPLFENEMRREVGRALPPTAAQHVGRHVAELLDDREGYAQRLEALREQVVFHFGRSGEVGAAILDGMLEESPD